MAITNYENRELHCKIIYFGASGAGKSANLHSIYRKTSPEVRAGLFDLDDPGPSKFFEFLPISIGYIRDYHIKLHLYTYYDSPFMASVNGSLLKGLDGYVSVFDSQVDAFAENLRVLDETSRLLVDAGYNIGELPRVMQYNKMDLENLVPLKILKEELNPGGSLDCFSVATQSEGTMETLKLITQQVLRQAVPLGDIEKFSGGPRGW